MITKIAICDRDKEYMYNFKEKIESMLGVVVKPFENLSELKENRKFEDYKLILVEDKLQSKIKEKIIITDNPNKPIEVNGFYPILVFITFWVEFNTINKCTH